MFNVIELDKKSMSLLINLVNRQVAGCYDVGESYTDVISEMVGVLIEFHFFASIEKYLFRSHQAATGITGLTGARLAQSVEQQTFTLYGTRSLRVQVRITHSCKGGSFYVT